MPGNGNGNGNGNGGASSSSKLKRAARKLILFPCTSLCSNPTTTRASSSSSSSSSSNLGPEQEMPFSFRKGPNYMSEIVEEGECGTPHVSSNSKNLCSICLEPLLNSTNTSSPGHAVFTSQCSHSFHLACISSNIRHGSITCPICRAQWTRLPRTLHPPCWLPRNRDDPVIRILEDSISTFRVHRRSFLRTARYDDDDPVTESVEARSSCEPRLCFVLTPMDNVPRTPLSSDSCPCVHRLSPSPYHSPRLSPHSPFVRYKHKRAAYLSVRLAPRQPVDLVLVASPNGPHLRLLKQCMSLAVFSLRPVDRLSIVSYSSGAARVFPLRRMTACGKRASMQVIDRLFYAGHADPTEGIKKGVKILKDRAHENPHSSILHLSDYPIANRSHRSNDSPVSVNQFHVGSTGSILHELEEFLTNLLGGVVREVQLTIGDEDEGRVVSLGELRANEEKRILLEVDESRDHVCISYSYTEEAEVGFGINECVVRLGEAVVGIGDRGEIDNNGEPSIVGGRMSGVDRWDYHDPYMARRWAKRLHGRHRI